MTAINRTASNVESLLQIEEIEDCNTSLAGDKTEVSHAPVLDIFRDIC